MRYVLVCLVLGLAVTAAAGGDDSPESLLQSGHYKRLRAWAEPRVAANPDDAQADYYLASAKDALRDPNGALPLAERSLAHDTSNAKYHLLVANICIEQAQKAGLFKGVGLAHRFRDEASKAASLDPKSVDARESLMEFYYEAPGIAGGDKKKAWAIADEIGKIDPALGFLAQASLAEKEKNVSQEDERYQKALSASPHNTKVLRGAALFYASDSAKKYGLAEKYALEALQQDEGTVVPYVALAMSYASTERWNDLDAILAKSEQHVPDDFGAHYQAARALLASGKDLPRSERYFRKYLTVEPEGEEPPWAGAHWRLGLVLEKEGRKAEAIAEMERSLQLEPDFKPAKEDLKRLKK